MMLALLLSLAFTTHFPSASSTTVLIVPPGNTSIVYAVAGKVLYRSDDGGATFRPRNSDVHTVVVDPTNPETLYDLGSGIARRSDDGGATWKDIKQGLPYLLSPTGLVVRRHHPSTIYLANSCVTRQSPEGGLFRSDDRGETWQGTPKLGTCVLDVAIDPVTDAVYSLDVNTFYAAIQFQFQPSSQIVGNAAARYGIGSDIKDHYATFDRVVLTLTANGWEKLALGAEPFRLAFDDATGRLFAATRGGLYLSPIGGPYWIPVDAAPRLPVVGADTQRDFLYINTTRGMYRAPLATLAPFTALGPLPGAPAPVRGLAADPHTGVLYAAGDGVWRSADAGGSWEWIGGDGAPRASIAVDGAGEIYALAADSATLFHYADGRWESFAMALPFDGAISLFASPLTRGLLFAIDRQVLYASSDGGRSWHQALDGSVRGVAFDPARAGLLFAATSSGVFASVDNAVTWLRLAPGDASAIAVAPSHPSTIYALGASSVLRSDDDGATWRTLPAPPAAPAPTAFIAVDWRNEDSVWIGGSAYAALWHSVDGGATWDRVETNLTGVLEELVADRDGVHIHVLAGGVWDAVVRAERRRAAPMLR